jgi:hypothetical protein
MDAVTRHTDQSVRLANLSCTVNEIRAEEDKDPFVELDDDGQNVFDLPGLPSKPAAPAEPIMMEPDNDGGDNQGEDI